MRLPHSYHSELIAKSRNLIMRSTLIAFVLLVFIGILMTIVHPVRASGGGGGDGEADGAQLFVQLEKPLIFNVYSEDSVHFVRITLQIKLTDPKYAPQVQANLAPIVHNLLLLLSDQPYFQYQTVAGKKKVRDEALAVVRQVVKEHVGLPVVDNIFFTSLVVQ